MKRKEVYSKDCYLPVCRDEEEPITFREFLLRERDDISPEEAKAKYEEYVAQVRKYTNLFELRFVSCLVSSSSLLMPSVTL